MSRNLKIIIPGVLVFLLALFGLFRLYQIRVAKPQEAPTPTPAVSTPSGFETLPTPAIITAPPSEQPASGVPPAYYFVLLGAIPIGLYLARFKRRT